jgi:glutathione peroxidase
MKPLLPVLAGTTLLLVLAVTTVLAARRGSPGNRPVSHGLYDFNVRTIDGSEKPLADFRGKTLLIVNTASHCGFTPQYDALEALYRKYSARGFEVLAFPANDFMGQEPGTNAEIQSFCTTKYNTTFPLFAKISVRGRNMAPLYAWLTKDSGFPGNIPWNFTKFLVGPDGRVVARFDPATSPLSKDVTEPLEGLLAKP